jgi:hypothetical protein
MWANEGVSNGAIRLNENPMLDVYARPNFPSHLELNPAETASPENNRQHARFFFCPACFERDGGKVLGGKDASRRSYNISFGSLLLPSRDSSLILL